MSNKGGNLFEKHTDKIILGVMGIICLAVLIKTFVFSASSIEMNGQKYKPGNIDKAVLKNAERLQEKVSRSAEIKQAYPEKEKTVKFESFMEKSIRDLKTGKPVVDEKLVMLLPSDIGQGVVRTRIYEKPAMSELTNAVAGLYRGVAYVPQAKVDIDHPYSSVPATLDDLDLVTVQAEFDIQTLLENFENAFAGRSVKEPWKDRSLARPVFAGTKLQRQEKQDDGSWSQWSDVPLLKTNQYIELLALPESISETELSDLGILYAQLSSASIRNKVLQPFTYDFAYPSYNWISPEFEAARKKQLARKKDITRRDREPDRTRQNVNRDREKPEKRRERAPADGGGDRGRGGRRERRPERERARPTVRPEQNRDAGRTETQENPEEDFKKVELANIEFDELEKLIVWAHDDTTEPGKTYRYRIKLGVMNPIANSPGAKWKDNQKDDSLVFWSSYVQTDDNIEIPERMYVFATDVKREVNKTVTIEVAKYKLGNWKREEFIVRPGESIGKVVEVENKDIVQQGDAVEKEDVDFATNYLMLDLIQGTKWKGSGFLNPRTYMEIILSDSDGRIQRIPAARKFWASELTKIYTEISDAIESPVTLNSSRSGVDKAGTVPGMF